MVNGPCRGGAVIEAEVEHGLPAGKPLTTGHPQRFDLGLVVTRPDVLDLTPPALGRPHDLHADGP